MGLYEVMVFAHVAAAVALLSSSVVASPGLRAAVRRAYTTQEMRAYLALGRPLLVLEPASALVVLATGIYLTSVANFWAQGWVQAAVGFWLVNAVVAGTVVKPAIQSVGAEAATAADGPVGQHLDALRRSPRWMFGGDLLMANDAAMLYVMTMKPALTPSLLVVAVAILVVAAVRARGHGAQRIVAAR
jgi:hypothetical protein